MVFFSSEILIEFWLIIIPDPLSLVCPSYFQWGTRCGSLHPSATQMFQMPWLVTMSIAATRMYRSLSDFLSPEVYDILFLSCLWPTCILNVIIAYTVALTQMVETYQ